ncbi:MAG: DHHW family protein [Butyribacter sp.]|nr:DHHW family protein [bacterium]MDY3854200.1 DHHW family protein [Butyribacter sp.]
MKRKIIYIAIVGAICATVMGTRIYHKHLEQNGSYLGTEVVDFGEEKTESGKNELAKGKSDENKSDNKEKATATPDSTEPAAENTPAVSDDEELAAEPTATPKVYDKIISHGKVKAYDTGTVVIGNAGYELYSYVDSIAGRYASLVNKLTKKLEGQAQVYTLVAPTSAGITMPDNKRNQVNSSSQEKALRKIQKKLSGRETFVPLYDTLMQHRKEYIYFRTDHHWTSLGAYYAYEIFCQSKGIQPNPLSAYKKTEAPGFKGTFYQETNQNKNLKKDTLISYHPLGSKIEMKYTTTNGVTAKAPVIADAENYGAGLKYCAYIAGDNPYTVIKNKAICDKSSCIVVKESYGNAFVPYLADHYQTIYVLDYRYWEGSLTQFAKKKKVKDIILINNISMTRNSYLIGKMAQIISQDK